MVSGRERERKNTGRRRDEVEEVSLYRKGRKKKVRSTPVFLFPNFPPLVGLD